MEHVGYDPGRVHVSVHTKAYNHVIGTQKTSITVVPGAMSGFHRYRVDWTPAGIRGYIDDAQVFAFANDGSGPGAWPFDRPFHLLLNLPVCVDCCCKLRVDPHAFPSSLHFYYFRLYRLVLRCSPLFLSTFPIVLSLFFSPFS